MKTELTGIDRINRINYMKTSKLTGMNRIDNEL